MRCRYLDDWQCKNKAVVWWHSIGVCAVHQEALRRLIESKDNVAEFVTIPTKRRRTSRALDAAPIDAAQK